MLKLENYSIVGNEMGKLAIAFDQEDLAIKIPDELQHRLFNTQDQNNSIVFFSDKIDILMISKSDNIPPEIWRQINNEPSIILLFFNNKNNTTPKLEYVVVSEAEKI